MTPRSADPYRDLDVIDARAPRFNQATVGLVALFGVLTGAWPLFALLAIQLTLGLTLGRQWCLPCRFYFEVVQPRWGEGPLEDSRPPRFANQLGAGFLWAATLASALGARGLGLALGGMVAALALLAAATGLCAGCVAYRLGARARGLKGRAIDRVDLQELGVAAGAGAIVQFTHPLCSDCRALARRLTSRGHPPIFVDVTQRPDLARKYGVAIVPLALEVGPDGAVSARLDG